MPQGSLAERRFDFQWSTFLTSSAAIAGAAHSMRTVNDRLMDHEPRAFRAIVFSFILLSSFAAHEWKLGQKCRSKPKAPVQLHMT